MDLCCISYTFLLEQTGLSSAISVCNASSPLHPSSLLPLPKNKQYLLFSGRYHSMPWHLSPSHPLTFLIWQLKTAVLSPGNIREMCKSVEWLAVVKHKDLVNSPFFLNGSINEDSFSYLGANACKTGKDVVSPRHLCNLRQMCQQIGNWVRQIIRLCK